MSNKKFDDSLAATVSKDIPTESSTSPMGCTFSQVDFITGDFNLLANRQFTTDMGGTVYGGIALEVLEDVVCETNRHLAERITYNILSSTPGTDVFNVIVHRDVNANLDCMIFISSF